MIFFTSRVLFTLGLSSRWYEKKKKTFNIGPEHQNSLAVWGISLWTRKGLHLNTMLWECLTGYLLSKSQSPPQQNRHNKTFSQKVVEESNAAYSYLLTWYLTFSKHLIKGTIIILLIVSGGMFHFVEDMLFDIHLWSELFISDCTFMFNDKNVNYYSRT